MLLLNKLKITLENCYGINKLSHEFDFTVESGTRTRRCNTFAIYAGNGVMKTSFANTFLDLSEKKSPREKIHNLTPVCNVTCDGGPLPPENIFVIKSYIPRHEAQNISKLLVSEDKKVEYDRIYSQVSKEKKEVIIELNKQSGVKKDDIETIMLKDFHSDNFFECLELCSGELVDYDYSAVKYGTIFNDDVENLLKKSDVIENIVKYTELYNKLIDESSYFKRNVFSPYKAENVLNTLKKERFFEAEHTINLKGESAPLGQQELFNKLNEAKKAIIENAELKNIQDLLSKKASGKDFQDVLETNPEVIAELGSGSLNDFKKKLWKSYILKNDKTIKPLLLSYNSNKTNLERVENEAISQESKWEAIIKIFKDRFHVPFNVYIENKKSSILGKESPIIVFKFGNGSGSEKEMNRDTLESLEVLSQGELRALYLLNIIFEVEARKSTHQKTLFIVDDIADSFDYQNKYAIISYLHENANIDYFYQLILTHNFDFFRTIQSRLLGNSKWHNSFIAQKSADNIELVNGGSNDITNPFEYWRRSLNGNNIVLIAMIPFVRNIIEYSSGINNDSYSMLTHLLHIKEKEETIPCTRDICISHIEPIFSQHVKEINMSSFDSTKLVYDLILSEASNVNTSTIVDGFNLKNKIVLSIAIRLLAEEFMWSKVTDKSSIKGSQTGHLFERYRNEFSTSIEEAANIKLLDLVNLITPENIHINSFMYEPILDMSEHELKNLYSKINEL